MWKSATLGAPSVGREDAIHASTPVVSYPSLQSSAMSGRQFTIFLSEGGECDDTPFDCLCCRARVPRVSSATTRCISVLALV